ncbi:MAG: hypothetical protein J6N15_01225 [Ruminiclostridium sp.]|nr:hypothetical protein [Ruminiclostridium sp.]
MISGIKKELMYFLRGGRLLAAALVMIGLAIMSPISFGMMGQMMQSMKEAVPDEQYSQLADEFTSFTVSDILLYNVEYVGSIGSIVILFLLKGAAGGEQKRRSVIIPHCSGLSAVRYALPKFIIYPLMIALIAVGAVMLSALLSAAMFPGSLDWSMALLSAVCIGVYLAFSTAVQFCIGICTGRANLAVVCVIIMHMVMPTILSFFRVDRFNPLALNSISLGAARMSGNSGSSLLASLDTTSISTDVTQLNVIVSIVTALIISVLLYFLTIFVMHTQEVHNEGDEPVL